MPFSHLKNFDPHKKQFFNPWPVCQKGSIWDFLKWKLQHRNIWPKKISIIPTIPAPLVKEGFAFTMVGHATFLIQVQGLNILTDPLYSETLGPLKKWGFKRIKQPGIQFENLPPIDLIVISHNHYDHLDLPTLRKLQARYNPLIIVPLGLQAFLNQCGFKRVIELNWGETFLHEGLKVHAVPAQHWSKRSLFDYNKSLWMGVVFEADLKTFYFAGDTGFGPHFEMIQKVFKKFTLSMLPIGAYKPKSLMQACHLSPLEALKAHQILNGGIILPFHYGVIPLAGEAYGEAEKDFRVGAKKLSLEEDIDFHLLEPGESFFLS